MVSVTMKESRNKKRCPFLNNPPSNNCYCVSLDSQSTPAAIYYCDNHFSTCEIYKNYIKVE